jgi:hypothetical protein
MRKRKLLLRSKRPLPRRLKPSPLRRKRRDPRLPSPRRLTQLVSMVSPELMSNLQEVEEVAVEVAVAREAAAEATEVVAERDVDLDPKDKRAREDPDPKVDSVAAEAKDPKVLRVRSAQDPKVDSAVAEAKDLKVLKVRIAQEPKEAEAEDPPELRVKVPLLKVKSKFSAPEERELSAMVNTASRARRESSIIPSTERTELAEAEVSLRAVLERATGEPPKRK